MSLHFRDHWHSKDGPQELTANATDGDASGTTPGWYITNNLIEEGRAEGSSVDFYRCHIENEDGWLATGDVPGVELCKTPKGTWVGKVGQEKRRQDTATGTRRRRPSGNSESMFGSSFGPMRARSELYGHTLGRDLHHI